MPLPRRPRDPVQRSKLITDIEAKDYGINSGLRLLGIATAAFLCLKVTLKACISKLKHCANFKTKCCA